MKKLLTNAGLYGLAPQISKIASIFVLPIITPFLTPEDYGYLGIVLGITGLFGMIADAGLYLVFSNSLIRQETKFKVIWRHLYGFTLYWNVFIVALQSLLIFLILPEQISEHKLTLCLLYGIPAILFGPIEKIGFCFFQLRQEALSIAWRTAVAGLMVVAGNLFFIKYQQAGFMGWIYGFFFADLFTRISYFWVICLREKITPIFKLRKYHITKHLRAGLPMIPYNASIYLNKFSSPLVMLFHRIPEGQIGLFTASFKLQEYARNFAVSLDQAFAPEMVKRHKKKLFGEGEVIYYFLQIFIILATVGASIWSKDIVALLIRNPDLQGIYPMVSIFIMATAYRSMQGAAIGLLVFHKKAGKLALISLAVAALNFVGNVVLLFFFGIMAAVLMHYASALLLTVLVVTSKEFQKINQMKFHHFAVMGTILLLTGLVYVLCEQSFFIKASATVILSTVLGLLLLKFGRKLKSIY